MIEPTARWALRLALSATQLPPWHAPARFAVQLACLQAGFPAIPYAVEQVDPDGQAFARGTTAQFVGQEPGEVLPPGEVPDPPGEVPDPPGGALGGADASTAAMGP